MITHSLVRPVVVSASLGLALLTICPAAHAQEEIMRPFRPLFGGNEPPTSRSQSLDFSGSLYGAYDDNILAGQSGAPSDPRYQESGYFAGLNLGLNYRKRMPRLDFFASGGTGLRYYPDFDEPRSPTATVAAGVGYAIDRRSSISATQSYQYLPYYRYGLVGTPVSGVPSDPFTPIDDDFGPGTVPVDDQDLAISDEPMQRWGTFVDYSRRLTPRSSLSAFYGFQLTDFSDVQADQRWHRVGAGYSYGLTDYLSIRARYAYERRWYQGGDEDSLGFHNLDGGLVFRKNFQLGTGRTQLSFGTGSAMYQRQQVDAEGNVERRFSANVLGNAQLFHEIGRRWYSRATYQRGFKFIDGFADPALIDSVNASIGGYLGDRVDVSAHVGYSTGWVGSDGRDLGTTTASARAQYAINSALAAYAQYFYYQYHFDESVDLPPGYVREQERQGVRVGLSVWLPLIR